MKKNKPYDKDLKVDEAFINSLPDLQNGKEHIQGADVKIQRVGISNFKIPLTFKTKDGSTREMQISVTGTVSLEAEKKGINMSRIVRSFYEYQNQVFSLDIIEKILIDYQNKLGSFEADIILKFSYPILQKSLRSELEGYQYYEIALEGKLDKDGNFTKIIHFDFVYSSACPCSFELGCHAADNRGVAFVSHSQRSIARISLKVNELIWFEEIKDLCLEALQTETQVMVKREDEQAFAELNGVYQKFVEDACRLLYGVFNEDKRIDDFKILCCHMESLHNHDAVGVIVKDIPGGFTSNVEYSVFNNLTIGK